MEKVFKRVNELGEDINVLNLKEMVIEFNKNTIKEREEKLRAGKYKKDMQEKIAKHISDLKQTVAILESKNMRYKFDDLFVESGRKLMKAKFHPQFIDEWKIKMDKIDIPPTIFRAVDKIRIRRAYNHIMYYDKKQMDNSLGAGVIEFQSLRYDALRNPQIKKFLISFSFIEDNATENPDEEVVLFEEMEV